MVFDANNSMLTTDHLAETSVIVIAVEIETIDLEENFNEMTVLKAETDKKAEIAPKAIGQEEIDPIRIDPHFVAATATKDPLIVAAVEIVPKEIAPHSDPVETVPPIEVMTAEIVLPTEEIVIAPKVTARRTAATATAHKATVLLSEATTAEIVPPIEAAAVTDPVAAVDSDPVVADSGPAVAVDVPVAVVDSDPAVVAEGLLAETKKKVTKPKVTKPKKSI